MTDLNLELIDTGVPRPYQANARKHSPEQIRQIERSIRECGFINPILLDDEGVVIAGHGRLIAAKNLGLPCIPAFRASDLSAAQKRAYRLADNKIAENATWDQDLLRVELEFLIAAETNFDVDLTGFSTPEIDLIFGTPPEPAEEEPPLPDLLGPPVTCAGDIWQLGPHRIACGDCRDAELLATLMGGEQASLVVCDPPYNVTIDGHVSGLGKVAHAEFKMASGEMSSSSAANAANGCISSHAAIEPAAGNQCDL